MLISREISQKVLPLNDLATNNVLEMNTYPQTNIIDIAKGITIGGDSPPVLFAGPCVIESEDSALYHAEQIKMIAQKTGLTFVFKASYDKANRTSIDSYRGPGIDEGLRILTRVRNDLDIPVITDAHSVDEFRIVGSVVDVVQIPAFLCRQTDLLIAAAKTGKTVNIKKGQFLAPKDIFHAIQKVKSAGNELVIITERGVSFGYNRLVVDYTGIVKMRELGFPVIFDATHSVQNPGGAEGKSGGESKYAPFLAWAAAAVGIDGLFIETHKEPSKALSDGPNMIPLNDLEFVLKRFHKLINVQSCN